MMRGWSRPSKRGTLTRAVSTPRPPHPSHDSLRPLERRLEELTHYTGRRAWARNGMTTLVSALVVAAVLVVYVRWSDMHRTSDIVNALRPLVIGTQVKSVELRSLAE